MPVQDALKTHYASLYENCRAVLATSFSDGFLERQHSSHHFIVDFSQWLDVLANRPEHTLFKRAIGQYQFSLLALNLGLYRQAFTALRLFLELSLAGVLYSANELTLREWLRGEQDIIWSQLTDMNHGVYSKRFAKAFFESLSETTSQYGAIATKVYRECSEYVHGNASTHEILSEHIEFNGSVFAEWHRVATSVRLAVVFALTLRYLISLDQLGKQKLESVILDYLGHISEIRERF